MVINNNLLSGKFKKRDKKFIIDRIIWKKVIMKSL